jgi:hypothetical protein
MPESVGLHVLLRLYSSFFQFFAIHQVPNGANIGFSGITVISDDTLSFWNLG